MVKKEKHGCGKIFLLKVPEMDDEDNIYWTCGNICLICEEGDGRHYCKNCQKKLTHKSKKTSEDSE